MPRLNYEAWARANNPDYLSLKDGRDRRREIIASVAEFPSVTAAEVAMSFEVSPALVYQILRNAGWKLVWTKK